MTASILKINKTQREVRLWVHPEGLVMGSLFLKADVQAQEAEESPYEVINRAEPFVVLKRQQPDEIRFYNRASIIRVEYTAEDTDSNDTMTTLHCRLMMMDGSMLEGYISEMLKPEQSRLYDFLNQTENRFIRLFLSDKEICLVNKSYIIQVSSLDDAHT